MKHYVSDQGWATEFTCDFCAENPGVDIVHIDAGGSVTCRGVCLACLRRPAIPPTWPAEIQQKWIASISKRRVEVELALKESNAS